MRIAFVTTQAESAGGSHVHVRDVSSALLKDGYDVKVFIGGSGPYLDQLKERGVPYHQLRHMVRPVNPKEDVLAIYELKAALKAWKPDVISTHSSKAGTVGRIAGRMAKIPTLFTAHGWSFAEGIPERSRLMYENVERMLSRISSKIICVADADRELAIRRKVAKPEQLVTVHNGMPDSPERANPASEPPMIISVARLDDQKDHPTLFRALAELKDIGWTLELVGDGPRRAQLEQLAAELGISDRVVFHGTLTNVRPILARAQLFALISNWEGFPRSTLEAMRTGLPVIVSDVAGAKEALIEGETGYSVKPRSVEDLQKHLRVVLADPGLRERMGRQGRSRYETEFTFDRMLTRTKQVYDDLLKVRR